MSERLAPVPAPKTDRSPSGRGRAALMVDWWPRDLPDDITIIQRTLIAFDGEVSRGSLYRPAHTDSSTVFCLMHPRQDLRQHPFIPGLLEAGHTVWAQVSRNVGNDMGLLHEAAILDVAAGVELLRDSGFEHIVLVGHSGGSGLYSLYTEQALAQPADRIARTPGGAPTNLAAAPMPAPDGLVLVAPHPGQGRLLLGAIDPSVGDERDPFSVIRELDPFDSANGFGDAPEGSHYSADFVTRYQQAQRERVARIDSAARELISAQFAARKKVKSGTASEIERRRSTLTPVITTYRTDADLRCMDLSLEPSDRRYGSVISARPAMSNYGVNGFGRLTTPEAWLSTWSGLSSNASLERSLAGVTLPTLVVEFTGDVSVFPSDIATALGALAASDVTHVRIRADHFGRPITSGEESGIGPTINEIVSWTQERGK